MTLEECIARKTKLEGLRDKAESALEKAYSAQSYNILGRGKSLANVEALQKQIERYDEQIAALDRKINGQGGIPVSYGIPL